jgi:hypothetical protein
MQSTRQYAIAVWTILLLSMVLDQTLPYAWASSDFFEAGTVIVLTAAVFGWFLADAKAQGIEPTWGLKLSVIVLGALALPYYRFRYSGSKAGLAFVVRVATGLLATAVAAAASAWVFFGLQDVA